MDSGRISFFDRMTSILNRYWWFWHLLVFGLSIVVLFLPDYFSFPSLGEYIRLPVIMLQLMAARFFQYYGHLLYGITAILFLSILFGIPQICLWTIRKRKYLICGLIIAALVLDLAVAFAHFLYCDWSTRQVGSFYSQSITAEQLYQECGRPLCFRIRENKTYAVYGDGITVYFINWDDNGIIQQMPRGSTWMD